MSTTLGNQAEDAAADFLKARSFKIVTRNWRTPACEIDIVAKKNKTLYFVEVKYRSNSYQGSGFDYITSKKLLQMAFAATCWVQENNWTGPYELAAMEVAANFKVARFIESIT